jgi:hypothetical protein
MEVKYQTSQVCFTPFYLTSTKVVLELRASFSQEFSKVVRAVVTSSEPRTFMQSKDLVCSRSLSKFGVPRVAAVRE